MTNDYNENIKIALRKALDKKKPLNKGEIVKQVRKARKELSICFDTNLIDARDRAINNCYFILDKIIKDSI